MPGIAVTEIMGIENLAFINLGLRAIGLAQEAQNPDIILEAIQPLIEQIINNSIGATAFLSGSIQATAIFFVLPADLVFQIVDLFMQLFFM